MKISDTSPNPLTAVRPPAGVFKGTNFMTPHVLAYYRVNYRGRTAYVELSEGRGITNEPIFGVTVCDANGRRFDPDPSGMRYSRGSAEQYIKHIFEPEED